VDEHGRKASASKGNVLDPWEIFSRYGSDAMRFYLFGSGPPGDNKRFTGDLLEQVIRGPFLTLWNTYRLYVLYANIDDFHPDSWEWTAPQLRPAIDRWALSELHQLIAEADEALERYDSTRAARRIGEFIDDLSNWYVRRSRRRFWRAADTDEATHDKSCAYWTLWTCLSELTKVMAPFTPFIAESMYRNLVCMVNDRAPESVHLCDFPKADASLIDPALASGMAAARELVSLGRSARTDARVKVRQPLAGAVLLAPPDLQMDLEPVLDLVSEELNVRELSFASDTGDLVRATLRPNYETAGPDFGSRVRELAAALAAAGPAAADMAEALEIGQDVDIDLPDGEIVRLSPEHVEIRREPAEGTAFAYAAPFGVSLDLEITDDLRREGTARELVHQLQGLRRAGGLEVTDRVRVRLAAPSEVTDALRAHENYVIEELLAAELEITGDVPDGATLQVEGHEVRAALVAAS
jgi:isoleucyl-tRNA synthetase